MSMSIFSYQHLNILFYEVSSHVRLKFVPHRLFYCRIGRAARLTARDPEDKKRILHQLKPSFINIKE